MASVDMDTIPAISINGPEELNGDFSDEVSDVSIPDHPMVNHVEESNSVSSSENIGTNPNIDSFAQSIVENVILSSIANLYVEKIIENVKNGVINGEYDNFPVLNGFGNAEERHAVKPRGRARAGPVVAIDPEALNVSNFDISDEDDVCMDSEASDSDVNTSSAASPDIQERLNDPSPDRDVVPPIESQTEANDINDVKVTVHEEVKPEVSDSGGRVSPESNHSEPPCIVQTNLIPATPEKEHPDEENFTSAPADQSKQKSAEGEPVNEYSSPEVAAATYTAPAAQAASKKSEPDIIPHPDSDRASPTKEKRQEIPKEDAKKAKKKRLSSLRNLFTCCATGHSD